MRHATTLHKIANDARLEEKSRIAEEARQYLAEREDRFQSWLKNIESDIETAASYGLNVVNVPYASDDERTHDNYSLSIRLKTTLLEHGYGCELRYDSWDDVVIVIWW